MLGCSAVGICHRLKETQARNSTDSLGREKEEHFNGKYVNN